MELKALDPKTSSDEILRYLNLLYEELFGPGALLSSQVADRVVAQWVNGSPNHRAFKVVDGEERVAAFFTLSESFAFFAHGRYGIINELWVSPPYRSQGVGKMVLEMIRQLARESGWERVDVSAPPDDRWIRTFLFYQKNGFVFTGKKLKALL